MTIIIQETHLKHQNNANNDNNDRNANKTPNIIMTIM